MAIRAYRRALPNPYPQESSENTNAVYNYEDVFVVMEVPLLELTHKDLVMLRGMKIDPFIEVE